MLSHFSRVQFFVTLWIVAGEALLSMGISRGEYWSGLPCPPPGDLPDPGVELMSLTSPALAGRLFITNATWEAPFTIYLGITTVLEASSLPSPLLPALRTLLPLIYFEREPSWKS